METGSIDHSFQKLGCKGKPSGRKGRGRPDQRKGFVFVFVILGCGNLRERGWAQGKAKGPEEKEEEEGNA